MLREAAQARRTRRALGTLPLGQADAAAIGHHSDYIQDILAHDSGAPRWAGIDHRQRVAGVTVPVSSIGGWYDIFLPGQLRDFQILQEAGRPARLTVGPWTHASMGAFRASDAGNPRVRAGACPGRGPAGARPGPPVRDGRGSLA